MDPYLIWVFVGILGIAVGLWLAKKMIKLAVFCGIAAALIYWFFQEDLSTTLNIAGSFF